MANVAVPPGEIVVDSRGRTSLARVRTKAFTRYKVQAFEDGSLLLTPAITVTPAELAASQAGAAPEADGEAGRHFQAAEGEVRP